MMILATSVEYIAVPVDGPPGVDLTQYQVGIAIVPDTGDEPDVSDYHTATWASDGQAAFLPLAGQFPPGFYMVYTRLVAPPEDVRVINGRLRIGDPSSAPVPATDIDGGSPGSIYDPARSIDGGTP